VAQVVCSNIFAAWGICAQNGGSDSVGHGTGFLAYGPPAAAQFAEPHDPNWITERELSRPERAVYDAATVRCAATILYAGRLAAAFGTAARAGEHRELWEDWVCRTNSGIKGRPRPAPVFQARLRSIVPLSRRFNSCGAAAVMADGHHMAA
jgi:hypothetical protein